MQINSLESTIVIGENLAETVKNTVKKCTPNSIFVVVDDQTRIHCLPLFDEIDEVADSKVIVIPSGEENKNIESVAKIWEFLSRNGADRKSLLIIIGGGMLTDLAGFAASSFKRGISFINIPTTLLSQVDASIGGKIGINFKSYKNEIGLFKTADFVIIDTTFLKTLNQENILSGFAEMVKHALIYSQSHWNVIKGLNPHIETIDFEKFAGIISQSLLIKNDVVQKDPTEKGLRKSLNFGHTVGHAIESWCMDKKDPVLHGIAVAYGMICELWLSNKKTNFDKSKLTDIVTYIRKIFGYKPIPKDAYPQLFELMTHDKKNENKQINFTLLSDIGAVELNCICTESEIFESLDYYNSNKS